MSQNAITINCVGLGTTGFPTETVHVKYGAKKLLALMKYDSWASHCMLHVSGAKDVGTMDDSCHTGTIEEAGRKVTATIVGNKSDIKIDFLLNISRLTVMQCQRHGTKNTKLIPTHEAQMGKI